MFVSRPLSRLHGNGGGYENPIRFLLYRAPGPIGPGAICHILGRQWVWGIDPGPVSRACGHDRKPMTGADMEKTIVGKLARLDRLPNTKNGNPMFSGEIITPVGELVQIRTLPDQQFSYRVEQYVGSFGEWHVCQWRGKTRVLGFDFLPISRIAKNGRHEILTRVLLLAIMAKTDAEEIAATSIADQLAQTMHPHEVEACKDAVVKFLGD